MKNIHNQQTDVNPLEVLSSLFGGSYLLEEINANAKKAIDVWEKVFKEEVDRRLLEQQEREHASAFPALPAGHRRIVVTYDPDSDINDIGYVTVQSYPEDKQQEGNDAIALLTAAAKMLAKASGVVDEEEYSVELLQTTENYMKDAIIAHLIGGEDDE